MRYYSLVRWVLILCMLLGGQVALAQEATAEQTAEPVIVFTETPTETPTATLTETPTHTPTESPTETAVVEETLEAIAEVTAEATASYTPTPPEAPSPTFTPESLLIESPLTLVYSTNFDDGSVSDWHLGSGWTVSGQAFQVFNSLEPATVMPQLFNVAVQARFELDVATTAQIGVRQNMTGGYVAALDPSGQVTLFRAGTAVAFATVASSQPDNVHWRNVRLSAIDGIIRVSVDGVEVIALRDDAPLPPGVINLSAFYTDATTDHLLLVDDVSVWRPTAEVPSTTATPTPTEEVAVPVLTDSGEPRPVAAIPPAQSLEVFAAPPPNNNFSGALSVNTVAYSYSGSTTDATLEAGELGGSSNLPSCTYRQYPANGVFYNYLVNTVWHRFTAPAAAEYNINTTGSKFDTVIGVYSGAAVNALSQIACHDGYTSANGLSNLNVTLAAGQTVYIQVGGFYSSKFGWFGNYTLQIKANVPIPARMSVLLSPANNSYLDDLTPELMWNPANGALDYDLQIDDQSNFSSLVYSASDIISTSHTVGAALTPGVYFWRVRGENLNDQAPGWSRTHRFTVGIQRTPLNNAVFTTATSVLPNFVWYPTAGAANYHLQIDNDANFTSPEVNKPGLTTTSYRLVVGEELETNTAYYWRVNPNGVVSPVSRMFRVSSGVLAAPSIITPTQGFSTNNLSYDITWSTVTGAVSYDLQVDNNSNFSSPAANQAGLTNPAYTFASAGDALYYIRVRTVNSVGVPGKWSAARRFTIDTAPPLAPNLNAPGNGTATKDSTPTLSWKAASGANAYRVQIDNNIDFGSPVEDQVVTKGNFTPVTPLSQQSIWYWRVRSRDAAQNWSASWSETRSFMVTIMRLPANNAVFTTTTSVRPTFSWYALAGATSYNLLIGNTLNCASSFLIKTGLMTNSYALAANEALSPGIYYWCVTSNLGGTPISRMFTVSPAAPGKPGITSPVQSAVIGPSLLPLNITWGDVAGADTYHIQIDNNSNFSSLAAEDTDVGGVAYSFTPSADALYYARVRAVNGLGVAGKWSAVRRFTIDTLVPAVPQLISPKPEIFTSTLRPRFDWNNASGANRYEIQLSFNSNFMGESTQTYAVKSSVFTPSANLLYRTYYWHVRALDAGNNESSWSETSSVTLVSATNIAPNVNHFTTLTPTLTWLPISGDGVMIEIQVDDSTAFNNLNDHKTGFFAAVGSVQLAPLPNGTYYWRMRVRDPLGNWSPWSSRQVFTIEAG